MNECSVAEMIDRIIEIAKRNNDKDLEKWAHLESEGYYASNKYLTEKDTVPEYREVAGEYRDYWNRTLVIRDPKLNFVNTTRLRQSVAELESLSKRSDGELSFMDPETCQLIKKYFKADVYQFVFNPASIDGILNAIKQEAIRRASKYIARKELMSTKANQRNHELGLPREITVGWLLENLSMRRWLKLFGMLFGIFFFGLCVSGIPQIKNILRYIPGYKVELFLPPKTADYIEKQLNNIVESHNQRLSKLQEQLLHEERLGGDHTLLPVDQEKHQAVAKRIQEAIREENQNYENQLNALKSFLE